MSNEAYWLGEAARLQGQVENLQTELDRVKTLSKGLFYELEGVIVDTEEGDGFDDVCLETVKRVRDQLANLK
jgi:hypothetical protein